MVEEPEGKGPTEEQMPLSREEYDPGKVNNLSYEDELKCWYHYVYRGNREKEWSLKVFVLGTILAALMVLINIYMGLKAGWGEGGSIIAVLLAFLILTPMLRAGWLKSYDRLETNMIQTMASAGGSLGNLVNVIPALLLMGYVLRWYDMFCLIFIMSMVGVLFAIPFRRQIVIIEKLRFPTGTACFQTIKALHDQTPASRAQAKALAISGILTLIFTFFRDFPPIFKKMLAQGHDLKAKFFDNFTIPSVSPLSEEKLLTNLRYGVDWSPMMFGIGFMTGPRVGFGMLIGALIGFIWLPEYLLQAGYIEGMDSWHPVRDWLMWPSTSLLVCASFVVLAFKLPVVMRAFKGLKGAMGSTLGNLEVPNSVFLVGMVISTIAVVIFMDLRFDVPVAIGILTVIFSFALALIAVRCTGETDINPVGALGHVTQIVYGGILKCTPRANLGAAGLTASGASEVSDMMQDLKTGYLLGATPKRQIYIEFLGVAIGSVVAVFLMYFLLYDPEGWLTIKPKAELAKVKEEKHLIAKEHLLDRGALILALRDEKNPLSTCLREKMSPETQKMLHDYNVANAAPDEAVDTLVKALNEVIKGECIYEPQRFAHVKLTEETVKNIQEQPKGKKLYALNRLLLQQAYPQIAKERDIVFGEPDHPAPAAQVWKTLAIAMSGGTTLFEKRDIVEPIALTTRLKDARDPICKYVKDQFSEAGRKLLDGYDGYSVPSQVFQEVLVDELNRILRSKNIYDEKLFAGVPLREETLNLVKQNPQGPDIVPCNRMLLEDAYPELKKKALFAFADLKDGKALAGKLSKIEEEMDPLSRYIYTHLSEETKQWLGKYDPEAKPSRLLCAAMVRDINQIMGREDLYDKDRFKDIELSEKTRNMLPAEGEKLKGEELVMLNRMLLQEAYPQELEKHHDFAKGALLGVLIGAIVGVILGFLEQSRFRRWMPSTIGLGISFIIPMSQSVSIFLGSLAHLILVRKKPEHQDLIGPIAAGTIAGEPIMAVLAIGVDNMVK